MNKKIVIITAGGLNGRRLVHLLHRNGIEFDLVTISFPLPKKRKKESFFSFFKRFIRGALANNQLLRKLKMRRLPSYPIKEHFVGHQNGHRMLKFLREKQYDYLLMMGGGIMKDFIIETAKDGVVNAHPGLLPYIRGIDAIKHSILKDIPLAVTLHFIDVGIDTGSIINRYWLPVKENDTFHTLQERSNHLCVAVMAKFVFDVKNGENIAGTSQNEKYKLGRKLRHEQSKEVARKLLKNWPEVHHNKKLNYPGVKSSKGLFELYDQWWPQIERF